MLGPVCMASKTVLGDKHPDTLTSMANLASTYRKQGQWDKVEELEVQVMEARKTVLGDKHPDTLTNMANLAQILESQGRLPDALALEHAAGCAMKYSDRITLIPGTLLTFLVTGTVTIIYS
jgi:hypothetical protein